MKEKITQKKNTGFSVVPRFIALHSATGIRISPIDAEAEYPTLEKVLEKPVDAKRKQASRCLAPS